MGTRGSALSALEGWCGLKLWSAVGTASTACPALCQWVHSSGRTVLVISGGHWGNRSGLIAFAWCFRVARVHGSGIDGNGRPVSESQAPRLHKSKMWLSI